jgi:hypothetical protein
MAYKKRRTRKHKKSKRRRQYGGKYLKGGKRRTRKSRRNQKGGCGCGKSKKAFIGGGCNNCNQGKFYTLREYNNLANGDVRNFYENTNSNHHVPKPYQTGGGRGTVPQQLGPFGDLFNGWHRFSNAFGNLPNTWRGKPHADSALPHIQPKVGGKQYRHTVPNFVKNYNDGVIDASTIVPPTQQTGGRKRRRKRKKSRKKRRTKRRR